MHWLIPRWFREDRPRLGKWYPIILPLTTAISLVAFVSAAIYTVPTGKDVLTARQISQKKELDGFQVTKELLSEYNSLGLRYNEHLQLQVVTENDIEHREMVRERILTIFEHIEMAPVVSTIGNPSSFTLDIFDASLIAHAALNESVRNSDWELANRAWTFQKKLSKIARDLSTPSIDEHLAKQLASLKSEQIEALQGVQDWLSNRFPRKCYERSFLEYSFDEMYRIPPKGIWILGPLDGVRWVTLQRKLRALNYRFPIVKSFLERIENASSLTSFSKFAMNSQHYRPHFGK